MSILVTGAAGFIGFHVAKALLERGERVVGIDNLNEYYDVRLKEARLAELRALSGLCLRQARRRRPRRGVRAGRARTRICAASSISRRRPGCAIRSKTPTPISMPM